MTLPRLFQDRDEDVWRRRVSALLFVLALHFGMLLLFLTLAPVAMQQAVVDAIQFRNVEAPAPAPEAVPDMVEETVEAEVAPPEIRVERETVEAPPVPMPPVMEPPVVTPPTETTAIAPPPAPPAPAAPRRVYGPPDVRPPAPPDSVRVEGTGPNGEPLYAAAWYREPYDNELRGYLSTAIGPGWGLIACRTVADYRVEDCVILGESPPGSGIARAVQAAAWQFRVRPPRVGGRDQVGEWVRIRIDYQRRGVNVR